MSTGEKKSPSRYAKLIERIFKKHYKKGATEVPFMRDELEECARTLKMELPKNLGDVIYSMRYRTDLPKPILSTQPPGKEWIIVGKGISSYAFRLVTSNLIVPNAHMAPIKVPDSTPEIVGAYALSDEQALLAKVRYNRLVDMFLGIVAYSLQNHLRTTVKKIGQVEVDELYVGIDSRGRQFVVPVQAKGGKDRLSGVQASQDFACCREKFPELVCRPISAQFITPQRIALFELTLVDGEPMILEERHYQLVPAEQISKDDLKLYNR